jgi:type II pantothenate kinase
MSLPTVQHTAFPLLADPDTYVAQTWDLLANPRKRAYWLALFRTHFVSLLQEAAREAEDRNVPPDEIHTTIDRLRTDFYSYLDALEHQPDRFGKLGILEICSHREQVLRRNGFADPYRLAKAKENAAALPLLPALLKELDATQPHDRRTLLIRGIFAGNIFDLGATATVDLFNNGAVDFESTRQKLKPRPWRFDDLDPFLQRWEHKPYRAAALFVDNAGPDILLGMIPFARELLRHHTRVILTANSTPSLNDVTHDELSELVKQIASFDPIIAASYRDGSLRLVPSGNDVPLIDLSCVSPELVAAVNEEAVDLVVLEGMGRAVETNLYASFACDALKLAMIKDQGVADSLNTDLYALVCKFEQADAT